MSAGGAKWSCTTCTFENSNTPVCLMCQTAKPGSANWVCSSCTCANPTNRSACLACGAPNVTDTSQMACPSCTFLNPKSNANCTLCNNPLGNNPPSQPVYGRSVRQPYNPASQPQPQTQAPPQPPAQQGGGGWFGGHAWMPSFGRKGSRKGSRSSRQHLSPEDSGAAGGRTVFKDVSEIMAKDENDVERIRKEEAAVRELVEIYEHVLQVDSAPRRVEPDKTRMRANLQRLLGHVPPSKVANDQSRDQTLKDDCRQCQICYMDFSSDSPAVRLDTCGHRMICANCFATYLRKKVKDDDIMPWLRCAAPDCQEPVMPYLLFDHMSPKYVYRFAILFVRKHLARNPNWVPCENDKCEFGFVVLHRDKDSKRKARCNACGTRQTVSRDPLHNDKGFGDLIREGTLRLCPKCEFPTMKDKGMCNVLRCGRCGIWWNWRSRETGNSQREMKQRARMHGTLWEPGELAYQQRLQRDDPEAFRLLLERNGIKYDPNYRRGT